MFKKGLKMAKNEQKTKVAGLLAQLAKDVRTRTPEHFRDWLCEQSDEELNRIFDALTAVEAYPALKALCDIARPAYIEAGQFMADYERGDPARADREDERPESHGDSGDGEMRRSSSADVDTSRMGGEASESSGTA